MAVKLLDERTADTRRYPAGSGSRYRDALEGISITANPASRAPPPPPPPPCSRFSAGTRGFVRARSRGRDLSNLSTSSIERIEIRPPRPLRYRGAHGLAFE